jgi:pilus assembly protein CpaE
MSLILLATASADLEQRVLAATGGQAVTLPPGPLPADVAQLIGPPPTPDTPTVLVLDCALGMPAALQLTAQIAAQYPTVRTVLVSEDGASLALDALRAGASDIVSPTDEVTAIGQVLQQAHAAARTASAALTPQTPASDAPPSGRVITVMSPKGGVGKTTVSTNIAVGLAKAVPNSTVLVDLDVQFGDVASALGLRPEYTLNDAVRGGAARDTMVLKTFLTLHETGLYVLGAPDSPAAADAITGADVGRLLGMLASEFQHVVVNTAPGLSEQTLAALDATTDPVLLTSMEVPAMLGLRKEIAVLSELKMLPPARQVVVNFVDKSSGLTVDDVEATIGAKVDVVLPRSKAVPVSMNLGVPVLQSETRDAITKELHTLVRRLVPSAFPDKRARRGLRRRGKKPAEQQPAAAPEPAADPAGLDQPAPRRAAYPWQQPTELMPR